MIHSRLDFKMGNLKGYNFEQFYSMLLNEPRNGVDSNFGYTRNSNPNFNLFGKGWLNKDIPVSETFKVRGVPLVTFKFGHLRIWTVPISAPGTKGSRQHMLGHFKVLGYQIDLKLTSQYNVIHESASIYSLLARSLIYDLYLIAPTHMVNLMNYLDLPMDIDLSKYIFFLHCPVLNEFKLYAHNKTYRLNWKTDVIDLGVLDKVYAAYDFNLYKRSELTDIRDNLNILRVVTTPNSPSYPISDYNLDIPEDSLYTELGELVRPPSNKNDGGNVFGINFIQEPEKLRSIIEQKFKIINQNLKAKDINMINNSINFVGKRGMLLNGILTDFNYLFNMNQGKIIHFSQVNDKYVDIVNSVYAWNFNLAIPIYFYYDSDLINHIKGGISFLESVIGPYQFLLSSAFKTQIRESVKLWPWQMDVKKVEKLVLAIFQIYFLLLMLSYKNNMIIVNNLLTSNFADFTVNNKRNELQARLNKLFNSNISKSTIMDNIYVVDDIVVFDPVINKIINLSKNKIINDEVLLNVEDLVYANHNMKIYSACFRKFLHNLLNYNELDDYLKE